MTIQQNIHLVLTKGADFDTCRQQVIRFFDQSILVRYDSLSVNKENCVSTSNPGFWSILEQAISKNREFLDEQFQFLKETGIEKLEDIVDIPLGYPSKLFHVIAHLLDGFVGIDSSFYNLLEDSHWVSNHLKEAMRREIDGYWLIELSGSYGSRKDAAFLLCDEEKTPAKSS